MKPHARFTAARQSPRRVRLDEGVLVLPPIGLRDLPPDGVIGSFMGIAALRFSTPAGPVAVFLHDLGSADIAMIFEAQRNEAEAQLGNDYARRPLWWERP